MLETAVWDRSCPMKIVQNAIAIVLALSGEFSSFTRPVLNSLELGSSLIELKPVCTRIRVSRWYVYGPPDGNDAITCEVRRTRFGNEKKNLYYTVLVGGEQ